MLKFTRLGFGLKSPLFHGSTPFGLPKLEVASRCYWRFSSGKPDPTPKPQQQPQNGKVEEKPSQKSAELPQDPENIKIELSTEELEKVNKLNEEDKKNRNARGFARLLMVENSSDLNKQLVAFKKGQKDHRSVKHYREAILFEDILKNEVRILLYDTQSKHTLKQYFHLLVMLMVVGASWLVFQICLNDPSTYIYITKTSQGQLVVFGQTVMTITISFILLKRYRRLYRYHVEKIIYDTETKKFELTKRNFFGKRYIDYVEKDNMVYSESPFLWRKGVNYFDMETKKLYEITERSAWIKEDLFSHLINQRINTVFQ